MSLISEGYSSAATSMALQAALADNEREAERLVEKLRWAFRDKQMLRPREAFLGAEAELAKLGWKLTSDGWQPVSLDDEGPGIILTHATLRHAVVAVDFDVEQGRYRLPRGQDLRDVKLVASV